MKYNETVTKKYTIRIHVDFGFQPFLGKINAEWKLLSWGLIPKLYWEDTDGDEFILENDDDYRVFQKIGNNKLFVVQKNPQKSIDLS